MHSHYQPKHHNKTQHTKNDGKNNIMFINQKRKEQAFVSQEPTKKQAQNAEFLQLVLSLPRSVTDSLTQQQLIGLGLVFLVGGAYAIEHAPNCAQVSPEFSDRKTLIKEKIVRDICADTSKATYNKPKFALGSQAGKLIPKSCIDGPSNDCAEHNRLFDEFKYDQNLIDELRNETTNQFNAWRKFADLSMANAYRSQSKEANEIFTKLYNSLVQFKYYYSTSHFAHQKQGGHCGEHTYSAMTQLFQQKIQYELEIKIQLVAVTASTSLESIRDHGYLLIDSNIEDVNIKDDKDLVDMTLAKITKGKICDPWNQGYYADFHSDESGFYKNEAGWNYLYVKTYSLNFANFNKLSFDAQRFICHELSLMGLDVEPQSACRLFKPRIKKENREQTQDVNKMRF